MKELNDILRKVFKDSDESSITFDAENNTVTFLVYKDYLYDNRGGFITILWDLRSEFLEDQSEEVKLLVNKYIF